MLEHRYLGYKYDVYFMVKDIRQKYKVRLEHKNWLLFILDAVWHNFAWADAANLGWDYVMRLVGVKKQQ